MEIHLRPLEEKDASGMLEWMTDSSITCFFRLDSSKMTRNSCCSFIEASNTDPLTRHYAIADEDDSYIGTISLKNINYRKKSAEYAICTRKCAHGTGAAVQATQKLFKIAFTEYRLEKIYLNVLVDNARANHFYKKVGFSFEFCEEHAVEIRNEWKDLNWYAISRADFLRRYEDGK